MRRSSRAWRLGRADPARDARADAHLALREDQRDPGARRAAGRLPRPARHGRRGDDAHPRAAAATTALEIEFNEQVVGNRSPIETPLMDAIAAGSASSDPGAEAIPVGLPGLHRLALVADGLPGLRRLRLLPAAPPDALRGLAAHPLHRRADRRARPRFAASLLRRSPEEAPLSRVTEDKLRLGGMALRNGLLVHGPTHWAAAVRDDAGEVKVASGRKPRLRAADGVPGRARVVRLGEAFVVIPLVKRALPEAKLPFGVAERRWPWRPARRRRGLRRRVRGTRRRGGRSALSLAPARARAARRRARRLPRRRAQGDRRVRVQDGDAADAAKEHDRCGSHLVAPMLAANLAGRAARAAGGRAARPGGRVAPWPSPPRRSRSRSSWSSATRNAARQGAAAAGLRDPAPARDARARRSASSRSAARRWRRSCASSPRLRSRGPTPVPSGVAGILLVL